MLKKILAILMMLYAAAAFAAVDVNKANAAELDGVKGIGPSMSKRILDERRKGHFKSWDDFIDRVKGVGEASAAKLSAEGLTINGGAFKGTSAGQTAKEEKKDMKAAAKDDKKDAKAEKKEDKKEAKMAPKEEKAMAAAKPAESAAKPTASAAKPAMTDAAKPAASAPKK